MIERHGYTSEVTQRYTYQNGNKGCSRSFFRVDSPELQIVTHRTIAPTKGACVVVIGGIHGNEQNAPAVVLEASRYTSPRLVRGSLVSIPVLNPWAIDKNTRNTPYPVAREVNGKLNANLNTLFNISEPVTPIEKHAYASLRYIRRNIYRGTLDERFPYFGLVIDTHSEGNDMRTDPHIRVDRINDDALQKVLIKLAIVSGLPWYMEYPDEEFSNLDLDGALSTVCVHQGIPALTIEAGASKGIDADEVDITNLGIRRILKFIGSIDTLESYDLDKMIALTGNRKDGIFRLADAFAEFTGATGIITVASKDLKPGDEIIKGQKVDRCTWGIGKIYGGDAHQLMLNNTGRVISTQLEYSLVTANKPFCMIAVPEEDERIVRLYEEAKNELESYMNSST